MATLWSALAALIVAVATALLKSYSDSTASVKVVQLQDELNAAKAVDAAVTKASSAASAVALADATDDGLRKSEQTDPDCRDCQ
jgi:hypothetical protein